MSSRNEVAVTWGWRSELGGINKRAINGEKGPELDELAQAWKKSSEQSGRGVGGCGGRGGDE